MLLVKIMLASFDYPIYTYDDQGMMKRGLPSQFEMTEEIGMLADEMQALYDPLFDTTGTCAKFIGFETIDEKDRLLGMSQRLFSLVREYLPSYIEVQNVVPQTLFLAPMREDVLRNEKEAEEERESYIGGGDCE